MKAAKFNWFSNSMSSNHFFPPSIVREVGGEAEDDRPFINSQRMQAFQSYKKRLLGEALPYYQEERLKRPKDEAFINSTISKFQDKIEEEDIVLSLVSLKDTTPLVPLNSSSPYINGAAPKDNAQEDDEEEEAEEKVLFRQQVDSGDSEMEEVLEDEGETEEDEEIPDEEEEDEDGDDEEVPKRRKYKKKMAAKSWMESFNDLQKVIRETGKFPSFKTKYTVLWRWLDEQVDLHSKKKLPNDKLVMLKKSGFDFIPSEVKRPPPKHCKKRFPLASWIHSQRTLRRKGKLSHERIEQLNKIGFIWEPKNNENEEDTFGGPFSSPILPESNEEDELSSSLDQEEEEEEEDAASSKSSRRKQLNAQQMQRERLWQENYSKLKHFKRKNGHLRVPTDYDNAKALYSLK